MVGSKSSPLSRPGTKQSTNDIRPPSYSEVENDPISGSHSQAYMTATTTTTVTTTTQTTTFFSLPLWRRRPGTGPPMASSAKSEGSRVPLLQAQATEDRRIARASSFNIDVNKKLPDIPQSTKLVDSPFARRSTGMIYFPTMEQELEPGTKSTRSYRSSTLLPPQSQSARTLAQAGLGIGLPHVMPLAATTASQPSALRPSTAPRSTRLESGKEVRRVKSFSRAQTGPVAGMSSTRDQGTSQVAKKSTTLTIPSDHRIVGEASSTPQSAHPESRSLMRRASFWNRRRVQSLKSPDEVPPRVQEIPGLVPLPSLPVFQPISPMFPERALQPSPGSSPHSSSFHSPGRLRRRHSERSTSTHHSPYELKLSEDHPTILEHTPHESSVNEDQSRRVTNGSSSSLQEPQPCPVHSSFISSPVISRFPMIDSRQTRPRSMTNPPNVLQRLSMGFFNSSSPSTPISSPSISTNILDETPFSSSPRQSRTLLRNSFSNSTSEIPKPRTHEESPEVFLGRLEAAVSKAEIANILASSGDTFYSQALQAYIDRFNFANDPLDIALRKLLMDVGLPKETQQIDRVIEAFAARYVKCNPNLFVSQDHPYILAFSLIMLHTDAFNKSNKRKMTKADYIKNTKLVGVSAEVLDYFFDNIIFAPFIFIEDPIDVNGQRGFTQDGKTHASGSGQATPTLNGSGLSVIGKPNKVDAYYLITRNLLGGLRVIVETYIPLRNPFSYQGTAGSWNEAELRRSFARAEVIDIDIADARRTSSLPFFAMSVSGAPGPLANSFAPPALSDHESMLLDYSALRVTKVGLLNRKDDLIDGGKRATNRRWREVSIILTGSQLLFYRDSALALNLIVQSHSPDSETFPPQSSFLRPDELLSVKDAIAVYDSSYVKHDYVVRLVMSSGRQILLQTENEMQRNEWIAHVNYASAFKTAGIRMRPVSATESARMDRSSYTRDAPLIPSESSTSASDILSDGIIDSDPAGTPILYNTDKEVPRIRTPPADSAGNSNSRSRIVSAKIREFESKIEAARVQLESDIRLAHNLAILTPFQRSTRDRLQTAVISLSRHIKQLRLEIVKATCFRDVLAADLASEQREQKLRRREEGRKRAGRDRSKDIRMHEDETLYSGPSRSLSRSDISDLSHGQPDSSICESFHSALDFGSDWPRSTRPPQKNAQEVPASEPVSPVGTPSHELAPGSPAGSGFFTSAAPGPLPSGYASTSSVIPTERNLGQRTSEEQAEEWDKTRAARRVSLVKVPVTLKAVGKIGHRASSTFTEHHNGTVYRLNEQTSIRFDGQ